MPLTSDITISAKKFDPSSISEQMATLKEQQAEMAASTPRWWEVGADKYREMRWKGQTLLPAPKLLPEALEIKISSRDLGRDIPCRLVYPSARTTAEERQRCKGTICHMHGGGWVLGDHKSTDTLLKLYADAADVAVISVGYRLAPEDPFSKGPEDCVDVGEYLVKNSESKYGGPLRFIGGESAGGHLSALLTFHLLKKFPEFELSGLLLHFGAYDLTFLPQAHIYSKRSVLDKSSMEHFCGAFLPNKTLEERKDPSISPFYEDLAKFRGRLPSALFICGTEDALLDDTVMMTTKWLTAGGEAIARIYPGAPHGFIETPPSAMKEAGEALADTVMYIKERMDGVLNGDRLPYGVH